MSAPIQIYASGDHYHPVSEALPDLKELTQQVTGKSFRRIGRFIQLAMIGAARCTNLSVPKESAVYLSSGRGDLELTVEIMTELFARAQTPKPLGFVNTVSNAACFYVAQLLGLQSRSNYVCNRYFAFESVLQLARNDLMMGNVNSALIGSIDVCTHPLTDHRQRLHLSPHTEMGEGSHWLWLGTEDINRPALGELVDTRHFNHRDELLQWTRTQSIASLALSRGQFVGDQDWQFIVSHIDHAAIFDYRSNRGWYDSHSGAVIGDFFRSADVATSLLHINADDCGRFNAIFVKHSS